MYPLKDRGRLEELCALFAKGLGKTSADHWIWKHYTHHEEVEGAVVVAEDPSGNLAGVFALRPITYTNGTDTFLMVNGEDLVIDPAHRGTGLMKQLFQYAVKYYFPKGAKGFIAFTNEASYPVFMKYGAVDMGDIYTYDTVKTLLSFYTQKRRDDYTGWQIQLSGQMPEDIFFTYSQSAYCHKKSPAFMQWKFADSPDGPFEWLSIRKDGELHGWMVVHITKGRFRRAVNIYDWDRRETVSAAVLKRAVRLLKTHGNWVSLWGLYDPSELLLWIKAGVSVKSEKGSHFLLYSFGDKPLPQNWRLTRADLDY